MQSHLNRPTLPSLPHNLRTSHLLALDFLKSEKNVLQKKKRMKQFPFLQHHPCSLEIGWDSFFAHTLYINCELGTGSTGYKSADTRRPCASTTIPLDSITRIFDRSHGDRGCDIWPYIHALMDIFLEASSTASFVCLPVCPSQFAHYSKLNLLTLLSIYKSINTPLYL